MPNPMTNNKLSNTLSIPVQHKIKVGLVVLPAARKIPAMNANGNATSCAAILMRIYNTAPSITSAGVPIMVSNGRDSKTPAAPIHAPPINPMPSAVCTVSNTERRSSAPIYCAINTLIPTANPPPILLRIPVTGEVAPTAARAAAPFSANRPTTTISAALYISCNKFASTNGMANRKMLENNGPSNMLSVR